MRGGWTLALGVAGFVLSGCGGSGGGPTVPTSSAPRLGGTVPTATPPGTSMDAMETPIARRLAGQVAGQGLHLAYLDCPAWDGKVPEELTCRGWFDHVEGTVKVTLKRDAKGAVTFDAVLQDGVIATKKLVAELTAKGYSDVDCGAAPAYPTDVGSTITCAVTSKGRPKRVVATITNEHGRVTISDF